MVSAQSTTDSTLPPAVDSLLHGDSAVVKDSVPPRSPDDSVSKRPGNAGHWDMPPGISFTSPAFSWQVMDHHPYFGFHAPVSQAPVPEKRQYESRDWLFYLLVLLLIIFALLRRAFPKYFSDLFRLFFRTTLKQRQIREQLMQTPLPSVLLNGFFTLSAGLYLCFILQYLKLVPEGGFWLMLVYCIAGLSAIYFVKFVGLKVTGWLFNMQEAADAYIFIVFVINKMIGIFLLPFLVLLAFTTGDIYTSSMTLSWCLVAGLLLYRVILTHAAIRNQVRVNLFHFFLYLCAFEIAPLLLLYRGLLLYFRITT